MADAMEFGEWLGRQLSRRGTTQADLAAELGVTRAAVSSWISGRVQPRIDKLQAIQIFLGLEPGPDALQVDAADRSSDLTWYHRPAHADGGRELGNAAAFAFESDLAVLAREATQNSLDERYVADEPVRVRYELNEISGRRLERFLEALRWESIEPHLDAAAASGQKVGRVLGDGLAELRHKERLVLLRIDDYNASGLTGDEYEDGRFAAVVRRQLDSRKTGSAGGTYGLGKATLWAASRLGTVLINSTLSEPHGGRSERRLVGRLDLPWHRTAEGEWAGPAWLGVPDAARDAARSWWADPVITEDLFLTRSSSAPGTSFLVVGVQESVGEAGDLEEMRNRLAEAVGRNFWAAMIAPGGGRPTLEASVAAFRDGEAVVPEEPVDPYLAEPSRARALRVYYDGGTVSEPTDSQSVVQSTVPLRVPPLKEGGGAQTEHRAVLLLTEADEREEKTNRLVTMRGSRMVVADRKVTDVPMGAPRFQAVLLAGGAVREPDDATAAAERFLRTAEPPDHDDWRKTDDLVSTYARGAISRIEEFGRAMTAEIRRILHRPAPDTRDEGPAELRDVLDLTRPKKPQSPKYPTVDALDGEILPDGAWRVRVTVKLPAREDPWHGVPVLKFVTRSGPHAVADWAGLTPESGCEVAEDGRLVFEPGSRTARFEGETDVTSHPVAAAMAEVEVELRRAKEAV
ncbi:helix-turn-helix domain-containing protein [Streptomonospora salina]|uniref:RNA polymerase primary sigma factor n=1 Tax=Streptomonospora salina TaxID=104205 RepID=A0A841EB17_9ACTN|nr:helix-turn-helix transcriptional regulator [Streptomonospora salina]MBB5998238.1 RNA polymerase primary sigma factor [Streptomonospora salina]